MKIAFIAMSGVRVRSTELQALGVSLPGFVERGKVIASLPSLGLLTLAACSPDDVDAHYFEHGDVSPDELEARGFDTVALSTFTAQAPEAYEYADLCRERGLRVVLGGLHVTVRPHEALHHADHVVIGEGELIWPEFLTDLAKGKARALYDGRARVVPLDAVPCPRYDLLDPERYNRITIQTTRSCPHRCTFCASGILLRGPYRKKPVELVQRDLDAIAAIWPRPFIELADDNTFVDKAWSKQLVKSFIPYRMRWFTETDVTVADDPELLGLLRESGCRQVLIGLEDVDVGAVSELEARPFKAKRVAGYAAAIERIQSSGISVNGCFILGADHQTPQHFKRIVEFADRVGLAEVQVTVLTPFPGTPLHQRLRKEGRLLADADWGSYTLFDVNYTPAQMTVRELEEGLMDLFRRLYEPEKVRERQRRFHSQARAGARARRRARPAQKRAAGTPRTRTNKAQQDQLAASTLSTE